MVNLRASTILTAALSITAGAQQLDSSLSYGNITSLLDAILARGHINVGTTGDYKPFTYLVTNQTVLPNATAVNTTYIGADIDAAQSLSNALGLPNPPHLVKTAWANITSDLAAGNFDIAMGGVSLTLARAKTAFFSTAVQRVGKTACIRCADAARFTTLASLDQAGVKVAVNPGGTNEAFDRANLVAAEIVLVEDNNAVYQAVLDGAADAMISDLVEVELQVRLHEGELCIANPDAPFNFEELGYAVPRDVVWKHFVDAWVHVQLGSGAWNATLDKWLSYKWPSV
ncbi:Cyclohexadienyl dehydratase [Colletotrichum spinosum]|uniref:Cyclohexadienyl dehydratase n=1 Tax=Colletotrichum spinosum TaxID=1347390 RepID=A0A4R8Q761_9PEZI|nr:Cyclohexadienyl dehydratase [Colletotrichum spinosum]